MYFRLGIFEATSLHCLRKKDENSTFCQDNSYIILHGAHGSFTNSKQGCEYYLSYKGMACLYTIFKLSVNCTQISPSYI